MPATPTLLLCDALVDQLRAAWNPVAPSSVERAYYLRVADSGFDKLVGRQVRIIPTDYDSAADTRGEDRYTHRIIVQVAERFPDPAADVPREWLDERIDFVYERVAQAFDFSRGAPDWNPRLLTGPVTVSVYDLEKLLTGKLFLSQVELVFEELRDA